MTTFLIVPGLKGSGEAHWQSWLEALLPGAERVMQADWETPSLPVWSKSLIRHLDSLPGQAVLVAHSFGCLTSVAAAIHRPEKIAGALLVAPANPAKFGVADQLPRTALPFPSLVVGSTNDPWMSLDSATQWADCWQATLVNLGAAGHINVDSGHGPWPGVLDILEQLLQQTSLHAAA